MPEFVSLWSVAGRDGDLRGELALPYLPEPGSPPEEVLVTCGAVREVDAWSFVAIRTLLEYAATRLLVRVTLALPSDAEARRTFAAGLGALPNKVEFAHETETGDYMDANVILPATRVSSIGVAELIASHLPSTPHNAGAAKRELSFLATVVQELLSNALLHASSPVDAIASIALEPEQDELQVVVCDLGNSIAHYPDAAERLDELWGGDPARRSRKVPGGLASILPSAERRGFDLSLGLYSGNGRLFVRTGSSHSVVSEKPNIPGFLAAATLHR